MTALKAAAGRIPLGAAILMAPCLISGRPQFFSDTKSYYVLGQEIGSLVGMAHGQDAAATIRVEQVNSASPAAASIADERLPYTVAGSRSPFYSFYLFLLASMGTAWLVVAVQCLLTASVIWAALRSFELERYLDPIILVLACVSSVAIFAFFIMPDFIMALGVLSLAVLTARWDVLTRRTRIAFGMVISAAALFHGANAIVLLGVSAAGLVGAMVMPVLRTFRPGLVVGSVAAIVGLVGLVTYPLAVQSLRHNPVYSPPFLAARVIADGPGRVYLRQQCGKGLQSEWCRFVKQPLTDNNDILWHDDPKVGVFQRLDYDHRVKLIKEQSTFVLNVIRYDPVYFAQTAASNVIDLLFNFRIQEVLEEDLTFWPDPRFRLFARLAPGNEQCATGKRSCASRLDYHVLNDVFGATLVLSLMMIAVLLRDARLRAEMGATVLIVFFTLVANAVIYGVISGNAERYQSRLMWLVPLLALCLGCRRLTFARARFSRVSGNQSPSATRSMRPGR